MTHDEHHARIRELLPKVTQGEWEWVKSEGDIIDKEGWVICRDADDDNASLIALAPETARHFDAVMQENARLREALKEAKQCLDGEPEYHHQGMGCGLEDRNITDRYEAMEYGWNKAMERIFSEHINGAVEVIDAALSQPSALTTPAAVTTPHPDELAVDRFAAAMKAKLAAARAKGRYGWSDPEDCTDGFLASLLVNHISKGNAGNFEDIANLAMMLHQRGADPAILTAVTTPTEDVGALQKIALAVAMQEKDQLYPDTREGWMMAVDDIEAIALAALAKHKGGAA